MEMPNVFDVTTDATPSRAAVSRLSWKGLLANRLLLSLLAVSLIPLAFMGVSTYRSASTALEAQALNQLETVQVELIDWCEPPAEPGAPLKPCTAIRHGRRF